MLRVLPLLAALTLLLAPPSQARLVSAPPASPPPSISENACTAFFESGSESRIGLLCHNDPVNRSDPMGLLWQFSDKKLEADFNKARQAFNNNPTVKAIFDRIAADKVHGVMVNRSESFGRNRDQFKGTDKGNASFSWNPKAAVAFDGGRQSPATVLVHEAAHADRFLSDPKGSGNALRAGDGPMGHAGLFNNMEERRVILGPEAAAAASMPGESARHSIESTFYRVDSVTDH